MRVLVSCEESGVVRDAFLRRGHDAYSNDLKPARNGGPHLQMDCVHAMWREGPWDIIIFHPDCTAMTVAGNGTYGEGKPKNHVRRQAIAWTREAWGIARKEARVAACIENPVSVLWKALGLKPQWIQPWQFGHPEQKKTGLGLDRLPPLKATKDVYEEMMRLPRKERERIFFMSPGPNRSRDRSETFIGIAEAMADQWGNLQSVAVHRTTVRSER